MIGIPTATQENRCDSGFRCGMEAIPEHTCHAENGVLVVSPRWGLVLLGLETQH